MSDRSFHHARRRPAPLSAALAVFCAALPAASGCAVLTEQPWPRPADFHRLAPAEVAGNPHRPTARRWAESAYRTLRSRYPDDPLDALTTDELLGADGRPVDVYVRFDRAFDGLDSLRRNFEGVLHTARANSLTGNRSAGAVVDNWPGYRTVRLTMDDGRLLDGLFGVPAGDGFGRSVIVLVSGLFGSLRSAEMFNIAESLRTDGHCVLAMNMRGHGEDAGGSLPEPVLYGVQEPRDLLTIDRRLRADFGARRVGMLAYSLAGNHALLALWLDSRRPEPTDAQSPIFSRLPAPSPTPAYDAGIMVVSTAINLVSIGAWLEHPLRLWEEPVKTNVQGQAARRRRDSNAGDLHRMWGLFEQEFGRSEWAKQYPDFASFRIDSEQFFDLRGTFTEGPSRGRRRMEGVRVPLLAVHSVNDPLASAQAMTEVFAGLGNPNCAVLMFAGGGHSGFNPLSSRVFYSLLAGFFDPKIGPAAATILR
jgi:pimeloyl-ACP methyl ester carboxylesterase